MKFYELLVLTAVETVRAQTGKYSSVQTMLIADPSLTTGTDPAGAIAGYSLTGQYWTSGKALHFKLGLTAPSTAAANNNIISTYLQFTNLNTTTATVSNYDVASCDLTITSISSLNTIVKPVTNDYYNKVQQEFFQQGTGGYPAITTNYPADTTNNWTAEDYSFSCGVTQCYYTCTLTRLLNDGDSTDAIFTERATQPLRAGWKVYTGATSTTAPT